MNAGMHSRGVATSRAQNAEAQEPGSNDNALIGVACARLSSITDYRVEKRMS